MIHFMAQLFVRGGSGTLQILYLPKVEPCIPLHVFLPHTYLWIPPLSSYRDNRLNWGQRVQAQQVLSPLCNPCPALSSQHTARCQLCVKSKQTLRPTEGGEGGLLTNTQSCGSDKTSVIQLIPAWYHFTRPRLVAVAGLRNCFTGREMTPQLIRGASEEMPWTNLKLRCYL